MPPAVTSAFGRLRAAIGSFTLAQRTIAIIGVAAVLLGGFALASWLTRPTLTPLFSGLSAEDASAVVEQLRGAAVTYELADGGSTVLVPESAVYEQRLAAAAAGLPQGTSDGYSLLDSMGVTSSEFQQSVTYKRAIEGELARTIASLDGVATASVQLAIPEESVFVSQTIAPTASVFLETRDGRALSGSQIDAIVHLTSAAVSGMSPDDVAVIDSEGRTLSRIGGDGTGDGEQLASAYETRVAGSIQQLLDAVVGSGNATVTVAAEMERASTERIDETYTPVEGAPPRTEQTSTENYTGGGAETGVLGPDAVAGGVTGDGTYESTQVSRENVVNKSTESTTTPAGAVARQSVAVAVDQDAAELVDLAQVTALVTSAAGIDAGRGDEVTVEFVAFSQVGAEAAQAALEAARAAEEAERTAELVRTGVIAGVAAIAVIAATVVSVAVTRRRRAAVEPEPLELTPVADPFDALAHGLAFEQVTQAPTTPVLTIDPDPEPEPEPEPAQVTLDRRRAEISDLARRDPARTADLLRGFLRDRQDA